jgi:hypothetical protein
MTLIKVDEVEINDWIRVKQRAGFVNACVLDIEYRPRALILQAETDEGRPLSVSFQYGALIETRQ